MVRIGRDFFDVAAGKGILRINSVQLEGRKRAAVKDFLLGYQVTEGMKLVKEA